MTCLPNNMDAHIIFRVIISVNDITCAPSIDALRTTHGDNIMYNISYDDSNLALFCGKHINPNQSINNLPTLLPSLSGSFSLVLLPVASPPVLTILTSPLWTLLTHAPLSLPFTHTMFLVDGHCTTPSPQ